MWFHRLRWDALNNSWSRFLVCRPSEANVRHKKRTEAGTVHAEGLLTEQNQALYEWRNHAEQGQTLK